MWYFTFMKHASVRAHEALWLKQTRSTETMLDTASGQETPGRGIFLAHAFSGIMTLEGTIDVNSQRKLTYLLETFRASGYGVHCALEREGWGDKLMQPGAALRLDMDQVTKSDYLVSFPQGSPGAFNELGFRVVSPGPTVLIKDAATTPEELYYMEGMLGILEGYGVAGTMIEDTAQSPQAFETTTASKIVEWVARH
jgi:hypothetical protein